MKRLSIGKWLLLVVTICVMVIAVSACGRVESGHTHTYTSEWTYDADYHWHKATCEHTEEINARAAHSFDGTICTVCKYERDGDEQQKNFKTVSFDLNGGNGELDDMQFTVGEVMASLPSPTRDGYTFICWEIPFVGEEYNSASVMPNKDLQLRAKWEKDLDGYDDDYVSFKPSSEGVKNSLFYDEYSGRVDKFVYVEITSDDLGGANKVGQQNNFNLKTITGMQYSVKNGYTWSWYQGDFDTPNGAQRFTLHYGSNIQFVTISDNSGVVQQTYLLDIYVKHDYYVSLFTNVFETEPYEKVRVIENGRFSADTAVQESSEFEFDCRVYFNKQTNTYEKFVYSTAITEDWNLYQTYKEITISSETDGGTLDGELTVKPYTQFFVLPSPQKETWDFIGWRMPDGGYLTNIEGYSGVNYISEENLPDKLTAVYAKKKYYFSFENDTLKTVKTVPVVTYTDKTMRSVLDITYVPYDSDCVLPVKTAQNDNEVFTEWLHYYLPEQGEYGKNLVSFDFGQKITKPVALAPAVETANETVVPLNGELTSNKTGTYKMYLPANKRYVLNISATSGVTLTINKYGEAQNTQTVTIDANSAKTINLDYYVYNLGEQIYSHGYVTFTVTQLTGSFTVKLVGDTAQTSGSPVVTSNENTAEIGADFTVPLVKDGYAFAGWYEGEDKISENEFIEMQDRERELTAKWVICPVTLEKSIAEAGSVSGLSGTTAVGQEVTVTAETKNGYTWVGWYDGETELTKELSYTFIMPSENKTFTAKWIKVTLERNNTSAGSIFTLNGIYTAGETVTVTVRNTNVGYTWVGWYDGETELTKEQSYTFTMPSENTTLTAKWIKVTLERNNTSAGYISELNAKYAVGEIVVITADTKNGYTWVGWYDGETKLTEELSYTFAMPAESVTYTAKWVRLSLDRNDTSAGTVSSLNEKYTVGQEVTVTATTNSGYTFIGWYNDDTELTKELSYTFAMPCENVTYTARWTYYTLTTERNNVNAGTITSKYNTKTTAGESVTITATIYYGYTWVGWYNGETELTKELSYTFAMPRENVIYTARWIKNPVTLEQNNSGAGSIPSLTGAYKVGESVTITAVTSSGYTWVGWYEGETELTKELSYTFFMPSENVTYTARWIQVTLERNNKSAGYVSKLNAKYVVGESVTVTAETFNGYTFVGWYGGETELTKELSYTFTMPSENTTYTAKWIKVTVESGNIEAGTVTTLNGKYIVGDSVTITATTNSGYTFVGWYKGETELSKTLSYTFAMPSENVLYKARWIICPVMFEKNIDEAGAIGDIPDTTIVGESITVTATTNKGYMWVGWYNGETELTRELSYTFEMPSENATYTAKWDIISELKPFAFTSNDEGITITGVKNTEETSIIVPDCVTNIKEGAFIYCSNLISLTLPFVGDSVKTDRDDNQYPFGYIFGRDSYNGSRVIEQWYYMSTQPWKQISSRYYLPATLREVTITGGDILYGAFDNCNMLTDIIIGDGVSIGKDVFSGCSSLTSLTIPFMSMHLGYFFGADNVSDNSSYVPSSLKTVIIGGTVIPNRAFYGCKSLIGVTIMESILSIGTAAFDGCTELIETDDGVQYVDKWIVGCDTSVTSVTLRSNTVGLADSAFYDCNKLTSINLPNGIRIIGKGAFSNCTSLTNVFVPNSVISFGRKAFDTCRSLESITIPFVGERANGTENTHFGYIFGAISYSGNSSYVPSSLKTVIIRGGMSISENAFDGCGNITNLIIVGGVTSIGKGAFAGCTGLTSISLPFVGASANGTENTHFGYIFGASSFNENSACVPETLESVSVTGAALISKNAFTGCGNLTNITIYNSVKGIGEAAFYECTALTKVDFIGTIAEWCTMRFGSASSNPLYYAKNLYINNTLVTDITVPNTVTQILPYVFFNCTSITNVTIADSVTVIGLSAFNGCSEITEITLGNGLTSIRNATFWACSSLQRVNYAGTIADWCNIEFVSESSNPMYYAKGLYIDGVDVTSNLVIPEGVSEIKNFAFSNCTAMTTVTISSTVTSIGEKAFINCNKLSSIVFDGTMEQWNTIAKGVDWNSNTGNYTIQCIDGDISKS